MSGRVCNACAGPISRMSKGLCKACSIKKLNSDETANARRVAMLRERATNPEFRSAQRAAMQRYMANIPEADREKRRQRSIANLSIALHSPKAIAACRSPEVRARAAAARVNTLLAWCPPEWRDKYREIKKKGRPAAVAKRIVLDLIAGKPMPLLYAKQRSRLLWCPEERLAEYKSLQKMVGAAEARRMIEEDMSPHERQMARLRSGAQLVSKVMPRRADGDFTLGGVSSGMLG